MEKEDSAIKESNPVSKKLQLKGLTLDELKKYFSEIGEPRFRGEQLFNWMYNHLVDDFFLVNNFPKNVRQILTDNCEINALKYVTSETSPVTGTKKYIFETAGIN